MPTDKTDKNALSKLKKQYGDEIVDYEYKHWRESYTAPPPPRSFCQGMTRYRQCYKVEYIKLKDGSKIVVGGMFHGSKINKRGKNSENNGCLISIVMIVIILLISFI